MPEPITCVQMQKERQKQEETYRQTRFIFKLANMVMGANEWLAIKSLREEPMKQFDFRSSQGGNPREVTFQF